MNLTLTTELEAINLMLSVIGENPVNTVSDNGVVDAVMARQNLALVSREVQSRGWHWNTEKNYTLAASYPAGEIILPANTMRVDTVHGDQALDLVQRGSRMYDRRKHTYNIGRNVTVDLVLMLPFDELPEAARNYIGIRAARQFQERVVGSDTLSVFSRRDEMVALVNLQNAEAETADYNILTDNWSVTRVLAR